MRLEEAASLDVFQTSPPHVQVWVVKIIMAWVFAFVYFSHVYLSTLLPYAQVCVVKIIMACVFAFVYFSICQLPFPALKVVGKNDHVM